MFSDTTRLTVSLEKSKIYITGMTDKEKKIIHMATGFKIGKLPFKYLGIPLDTKKSHLLIVRV